ncbi:MAG: replicative DNA helicase [Clostridia bacterium]|nr:replicative DNA helicase [Clostridia bacterium]
MPQDEEKFNLPFNDEAERAVLGSILLSPETSNQALDKLTPDDFFSLKNREVFRAMKHLWDRGGSIDVVTVLDALEKLGKTEASGGIEYLTELSVTTPTAMNVDHYTDIVIEESTRRRLISVCTEVSQDARTGSRETSVLLDDAERRIMQIAIRTSSDETWEPIAPVYGRVYHRVGELMKLSGQATGLRTGFYDLDEITSGLQRSDLIIIAGRPASGKSTLALNIAAHAALREGATVAFFNLEMSREQLAMRVMATETGIPLQSIKTGRTNPDQLLTIAKSFGDIGDAQLLLDDTPGITVSDLRSRCRRIKAQRGLDLVIVDYLQLMGSTSQNRSDSRVQVVSEMTRSLKILARELDVPLVVLSQLSREPDKRPDHTPHMSDLRESGSIEQDADIIMMLYRPAAYADTEEYANNNNIAYLDIVKHRNGETRRIELTWIPELTKFSSYSNYGEN